MNCNDESGGSRLDMVIDILREFNKWRRSEGKYGFDGDDPSMNKPCPYTPEEIGKAIDYAVEFIETWAHGLTEAAVDGSTGIPDGNCESESRTILKVNTQIF